MKSIVAALIFSLFLFATAQAGDDAGTGGSHRTPSPEEAAVSFRTLKNGDIVEETFRVQFSVSGMGVAPAGSNIPNTGHHHLLIDVVDLPDMDQPLPATDNIRHFGKGQTETELVLPEGEHSLQLLLADYSHTPHDPPVMSQKIIIIVSDGT